MNISFEGTLASICLEMKTFLNATDEYAPADRDAKAEKEYQGFRQDFQLDAKDKSSEVLDDPLPDHLQPEPAPANPAPANPAPAAAPVNRRKPVPAAKPKAASAKKKKPDLKVVGAIAGGLSDQEITKAASETACQTSPDVVKDIMKELGMAGSSLVDLSQDQRENFLTRSQAAIGSWPND